MAVENKTFSGLNIVLLAVAGVAIILACFAAGFMWRHPPETPDVTVKPEVARETGVEMPVVVKQPGVVYENNFGDEPGPEWNLSAVQRTLKGGRPYLGDFFPGSKPALRLHGLPTHKLVRVTFDLFLFKSWDGSNPTWGPGLMDVSLGGEDGRSLLHATFSNCGFFSDNNEQSFPDNYPAKPFPAWTLAAENQSLGTTVSWGGPERTFDSSGVYHMAFAFPHTAGDMELAFDSTLPDNPNKPYGLANFKVEALADLVTFTPEELKQLWADLGNATDPKVFWEARWKLASAGDAATDYMGQHYRDLAIPENPVMRAPGGHAKAYPMDATVIQRERARWVLEAIHTPAALRLKDAIPTVIE